MSEEKEWIEQEWKRYSADEERNDVAINFAAFVLDRLKGEIAAEAEIVVWGDVVGAKRGRLRHNRPIHD